MDVVRAIFIFNEKLFSLSFVISCRGCFILSFNFDFRLIYEGAYEREVDKRDKSPSRRCIFPKRVTSIASAIGEPTRGDLFNEGRYK